MSANGNDLAVDGGSTDLTDLVDFPRETLEIELKQWINLRDRVAQAKLARHIAALANHGGGWIVFGFCDDGTPDPDQPSEPRLYNRDTFATNINRLLTPAFQCDVQLVQSSAGLHYPVVRVPSLSATPTHPHSSGAMLPASAATPSQ